MCLAAMDEDSGRKAVAPACGTGLLLNLHGQEEGQGIGDQFEADDYHRLG